MGRQSEGKGRNPEQLALWGNIQVYANRSAMPSLSGQITVNDSRRLWEAIERELFTPDPTVVHTPRNAPRNR